MPKVSFLWLGILHPHRSALGADPLALLVKDPLLFFHFHSAPPASHIGYLRKTAAEAKEKFKVDWRRRGGYRRRMKRCVWITIILPLALLSCGGQKTNQVSISWWHFWTDAHIRPVVAQMVDDFEKEHPGVSVELVDLTWADGHDKIAIAYSSGSGPDMVELGSDWILEFSSTGHLENLTDRVQPFHDQYLMWEPGEYHDSLFAFPWILGTRVLFVNCDLLTQAGYDSAFSPRDWPELMAAAQAVSERVQGAYGFGSNSAERHRLYKKFLPFLWSNGGEVLSGDGQECLLGSPEALEALEYYITLCKTGLTDTQRRLEDAFLEGKIAFLISGDWLLKRLENEKCDFKYVTQLIPPPKDGMSSASFAGGEYLALNARSQHKDIAFELIQHICSAKNQLRFCLANRTPTPSSKEASADPAFVAQPHFDTFIRQLSSSRTTPAHPKWVYIEGKLEKAVEEALYGTKSPEQALKDAKAAIKEILIQ